MTKDQLEEIHKFVKKEVKKVTDPQHGIDHLERVRINALRIVKILELEKEIDQYLLQAACYLHDIHYTKYSLTLKNYLKGEYRLLKKVLPEVLKRFDLTEADRYLLKEAVYRHSGSVPFKRLNKKYSLYAQIVQDADTLDFFSKIRLLGLNKNKAKFRFYRFLSFFTGTWWRQRKNMHKYLNLPEIIDYLTQEDK